ncbi:MAG: hypothetical protein ABI728_01645 [Betaproteobacteria bacterium]
MATTDWKLGCRLVQSAWIVLALWGGGLPAAESPAFIKNRALAVGAGKEVDAAVTVVAIDARPVADEESDVEVAPGRHEIEVACTARVFVGMGTVDFPSKSVLTIEAQSGRIYRLDAKVTVQGDCTPVLQ